MATSGKRKVEKTIALGFASGVSDENTTRIIAIAPPAPITAAITEEINTSFNRMRSYFPSKAIVHNFAWDGSGCQNAGQGYHSLLITKPVAEDLGSVLD